MLRWNKALWLAIPSTVTVINQSDYFITLKFVDDIGYRLR